tara:strand:+ start:43 stop:363 length:321 start_codon:yes stop_codon:yes gene_type:complete
MYTQETGRGPLKNKKFEELTNGTPLRQEKSRFERAKEIANKKSMDDGGYSYYTGSMGSNSGRGSVSGKNRDIGSYAYNFAKEMISPSKPKPSAKETKGSGFGGRGY